MPPLQLKVVLVSPTNREASLQLFEGDRLVAHLRLTAEDMEGLITLFASARSKMSRAVPDILAEGMQLRLVQVEPEFACAFAAETSQRVLAVRHDGLGWLGFQFSKERRAALAKVLLEEADQAKPDGHGRIH